MSMIPEEVIEQIRDAADMVGIIGEAVQLKRMGADYRGPCPFHGGSNKNFAVIQKKGMYYCFVCHASGDIFTWLMRRFGMDYPTAVRDVARRVGIVIPETQSRQGPDPREPLFQAVAMAQDFFAKSLQEGEEAKEARAYLEGREIPLATAGEWGLGYAPRGTALIDEMKRLGIEEPVLLEAGLLHQRDDGTLRARFRGRLQFPIHDVRGRVVGFGGRILDRGEPKYLNSPECPIFHKGSLLYHLHLAKGAIRREETALVVEGYFDVLRLYAAGIENVVAALGTALTTEQGATLRRYAKTAVLLYDSDKAGLRATFRSGDVLLGHGLLVKVVTLPPDSDPDSIVRTKGVKALQALVRDAIDVLDRKLQLLDQRGWLSDVQRKREALDRLLPTLRAVSDPVVKDLYVGRVAERLGVSRETLTRELRSHPSAPMHRAESAQPARARPSPAARVEEQLLKILLAAARWRSRARDEVPPEWFENSLLRAIFSALVELPPDADAGDVAPNLPADAVPTFDRLREAAGGLTGQNLDEAYAAACDKLRDRIEFRRVGAMKDPEERRRAMAAWSEQRTQHYSWHKAAGRGSRPARTPSSPQE